MDVIQYTPNGDTLFHEPYYNTYFKSSPIAVLEAKYEFNRNFALGLEETTLYKLYSLLDLTPPEGSMSIGWSYDYLANEWDTYWIDFIDRPYLTIEGTPYTEICYPIPPGPMEYDLNY